MRFSIIRSHGLCQNRTAAIAGSAIQRQRFDYLHPGQANGGMDDAELREGRAFIFAIEQRVQGHSAPSVLQRTRRILMHSTTYRVLKMILVHRT